MATSRLNAQRDAEKGLLLADDLGDALGLRLLDLRVLERDLQARLDLGDGVGRLLHLLEACLQATDRIVGRVPLVLQQHLIQLQHLQE